MGAFPPQSVRERESVITIIREVGLKWSGLSSGPDVTRNPGKMKLYPSDTCLDTPRKKTSISACISQKCSSVWSTLCYTQQLLSSGEAEGWTCASAHPQSCAGLPPLLMFSLAHVWTPLLWHVPLHNPVHPLPLPFPNPFHVLLVSWTWIISVSLSRLRIFPSLSSYKNPHLCRWTRFCHGRLRGTDCTRLNVARGD